MRRGADVPRGTTKRGADVPRGTTDTFFDDIYRPCPLPNGTRVEVTGVMPDDPAPMEVGARGTVIGGNGGQIWVLWDNGRSLILLTTDPYRVLPGGTAEQDPLGTAEPDTSDVPRGTKDER